MSLIGRPITQKGHHVTNEAASLAMCMATWTVPSMIFKTVLDLKVLDIINVSGPLSQLSPTEIVAQLPTQNPDAPMFLDRMLRLLASFDILTFSARVGSDGRLERLYGLGPMCQFLVRNDDDVSYAAFADYMHDKIIMETWKHLKDAVLEGGTPFQNAYGMGFFDYLGTDSRFYKVFYNAMDNHSTIVMKEILENYEGLEGISSLVDVGGATGLSLTMIRAKYPNIKAINFDLPHIIKDSPSIEGVEHVGGDMFVSVPKADAIFMKWTFQTSNDENCVKLLKNCYASLPEEGRLIMCEYVVPELPEHSPQAHTSFIFDAIMMTFHPGGKARTKTEYETLGKQAGFEGFRVVSYASDTWVMEYLKKHH